MDQERWQKVQGLFEEALEQPPEEVSGWLEKSCGDDPTLRTEVEELLRSDAEAGSFIRTELIEDPTEVGPGRPVTPIEQPPPPKFGKYEIEAKVGQGGFGVVYRGRDPVLGRQVALKTCTTADGHLRRRFFREGRIAAGLQHPNVTTVHDLGVVDGVPFLVQEFLQGEDLDHLIDRREPLTLVTKLDYLVQVARGLEYAHGAGVLHRDIKPGNVRVHQSGAVRQIKIMDFGIARLLNDDTRLTGTGMAMGTVGYLAPEQLRGEDVDTRADVFSYGVLAYELLSYTRPFRGENFSQVSYQLLYVDPPPLAEAWPQCPEAIGAIVDRCLEKDPARRYITFTEVLQDLEPQLDALRTGSSAAADEATLVMPTIASDAATAGVTPPEVAPASRSSSRQGAAVVGLTAAVAVAAIVGWQTLDPAEPDPAPAALAAGGPVAASTVPAGRAPSAELEGLAGDSIADSAQEVEEKGAASVPPVPSPPASEPRPAPDSVPPPVVAAGSAEPAPVPSDSPPTPEIETPGESPPEDVTPGLPGPEPTGAESAPPVIASTPAPGVVPADPPAEEPAPQSEAPELEASKMVRGALLTPGPGVIAPHLIERPQPRYPERARRRRKEARVVVRVLVDENGRVLQAIAPAAGRFGFAAAAKQAALGASFEPATRDGIAGKMWTEIPFEFKLK